MKLQENVITTLNLTSLIVKRLRRHEFAYISNIFADGRHISAENTSVTRMLVKNRYTGLIDLYDPPFCS